MKQGGRGGGGEKKEEMNKTKTRTEERRREQTNTVGIRWRQLATMFGKKSHSSTTVIQSIIISIDYLFMYYLFIY